MSKYKGHKIKLVHENSIAYEMDIVSGDILLTINDMIIKDVFDYRYLVNDEYVQVEILKEDGDVWVLDIEKDYDEDLGIEFESGLMDEYHSCRNKCIFCFIDQMPPEMRDTLYFKDDDSRLSFLQGNYITLTNMKEEDIDRIIKFNLAPINISIHTTNPDLRCQMLSNRFAGKCLKYIDRLFENQIEMNGQIVLCKDVNDGTELERTIDDLSKYLPFMKSVSVVPAGLTKFRDGLFPLKEFSRDDARYVIRIIESRQKEFYERYGLHFIHASDEWYIMAGLQLPEKERYDGYLQLENGVGMVRALINECSDYIKTLNGDERQFTVSVATGKSAYDYLKDIVKMLNTKFPNIRVNIYMIINRFFGESITVSGLITGTDLREQLKNVPLGSRLLLPTNMLKSGEAVFLDDVTVSDLEKDLQININIVQSNGVDLINKILGENIIGNNIGSSGKYEL